MRLFFRLLNSISIRTKLRVILLVGIVLPLLLILMFLTFQLVDAFTTRENQLINDSIQQVSERVGVLFDDLSKIGFVYAADVRFNEILEDFDSPLQYEALTYKKEIRNTFYNHMLSYDFIEEMKVYHNNKELGENLESVPVGSERYNDRVIDFLSSGSIDQMIVDETGIYYYRRLIGNSLTASNALEIKLDQDKLAPYIQDAYLDNHNTVIYLVTNENQLLFSSDNQMNRQFNFVDIPEGFRLIDRSFSLDNFIEDWHLYAYYEVPDVYETETGIFVRTIALSLLILVAAFSFTFLIGKTVLKRLYALTNAMNETKEGSFTLIQESFGSDEIGEMTESYNTMVSEIHNLVQSIEASEEEAKSLLLDKTSANEELRAINEELSNVNEELAASYEEIRHQDEKINDLIYNDPLTKLMNRRAISEAINMTLLDNQQRLSFAVVFMDIDNFKYINDTHGHDTGDNVIIETGFRLKQFLSPWISVGRFGGDEFLIIIRENRDGPSLTETVEEIREAFIEPIVIDKNKFYLTNSLGVAIYPQDGITAGELVKHADQALYQAKETGRNRYVIFDSAMNDNLNEKLSFQSDIKEAFENNEFYLNYQPYYDSHTMEINGFEALIRWKSATRGYVSAYELIKNAEEMGLIVDIGKWVLMEALKAGKAFNEASQKELTISINLSAVQLQDVGLYHTVMEMIEEVDIDPRLVCLEMTETVLIDSIEKGSDVFNKFRDAGIKIALDDFGTGYSSLSYFRDLPLSILKIDKNFVDNIIGSHYDQDLIMIMVTIAHNKNITVTAEGVETDPQMMMLKAFGVDTLQGYLMNMPVGFDAAIQLIEDQYKDFTKL